MSRRFQIEVEGRMNRLEEVVQERLGKLEDKVRELKDQVKQLIEGRMDTRKPINPHKPGAWPKSLEQAGFKKPKKKVAQKEEPHGSDEG